MKKVLQGCPDGASQNEHDEFRKGGPALFARKVTSRSIVGEARKLRINFTHLDHDEPPRLGGCNGLLENRALLIVGLCMFSASAPEQVAMTGTLAATRACPAYQSIRNQTNPGGVITEPGNSYKIIGKNKEQPTYFQIVVDGLAVAEMGRSHFAAMLRRATLARSAVAPATHVLRRSRLGASLLPAALRTSRSAPTKQLKALTRRSSACTDYGSQPRGKAYCNVARDPGCRRQKP